MSGQVAQWGWTSTLADALGRAGLRGREGASDSSDRGGSPGGFAAWNDADRFGAVRIAAHGAIAWGDDLELCPDALYVALTGRSVEEIMPGARDSSGGLGPGKPSGPAREDPTIGVSERIR